MKTLAPRARSLPGLILLETGARTIHANGPSGNKPGLVLCLDA